MKYNLNKSQLQKFNRLLSAKFVNHTIDELMDLYERKQWNNQTATRSQLSAIKQAINQKLSKLGQGNYAEHIDALQRWQNINGQRVTSKIIFK